MVSFGRYKFLVLIELYIFCIVVNGVPCHKTTLNFRLKNKLVKETIHHLLIDCDKEDISELLRNKYQYYKHEISFKKLQTVNLFQNEVYRLVKKINKGNILYLDILCLLL